MPIKIDTYTWKARIVPAGFATAPAIAVGFALLPVLPNAQELWSMLTFAMFPFAALGARYFGNRVQPGLWASWGGAPTTRRLRYAGAASVAEISRRHRDVERALGGTITLPSATQEANDPHAADAEYDAVVNRLVNRVRRAPETDLLRAENANYGLARNLAGLRPAGQLIAAIALVVSAATGAVLLAAHSVDGALVFILPAAVSIAMLALWRLVTPSWVRPSAEAYADRLMEAAQILASDPRSTTPN